MKSHPSFIAAVVLTFLTVGGLSACSSAPSTDASAASSGPVKITVGDRPSTSDPKNQAVYDAAVTAFEQANPDITLVPSETIWNATTFSAQAAGGQLPDVFQVPFTEPQGLIARKQVADLTEALKATGLDAKLNPVVLKVAQNSDGNTFAVPTSAYSIGLIYNRALFTKAGLDPDKPPTTWADVRTDAKAIADATGATGYAQMTTSGTGGWMLTAQTYSFGGTIENEDGTAATFDSQPTKDALDALQKMKWVDNSMGQTVLYDATSIAQDFAAGKIGMYMAAPDAYSAVVYTDHMDSADFGVGGLPQADGASGTLSGGSVQVVSPTTTESERVAAVKWIEFRYLNKFVNQDAAVADSTARTAKGLPVGVPGLPVLSEGTQEAYNGWIKPYVNVPVANLQPFITAAKTQQIIPEPTKNSQDVYATLDPVVQAVLGQQNADVNGLLSAAATQVTAKLGR